MTDTEPSDESFLDAAIELGILAADLRQKPREPGFARRLVAEGRLAPEEYVQVLSFLELGRRSKPTGETDSSIGPYRVVRTIGRGGFGTVFEAVHERMNARRAVKVIPASASATARARFQREVATLAQLRHANVVTIHEAGETRGALWFAMELVEGGSLENLLHDEPPDERRATRLVLDAARGVAALHERGHVHRDLKPSNLLVDAEGRVKVADFGLARSLEGETALTKTGALLGTPRFMAPEQILAGPRVGPEADVYALGLILRTALGEEEEAGNVFELATRRQQGWPPVRLRDGRPLAPALQAVLDRALDPKPELRYVDARELVLALEAALAGQAAPRPARRRPSGGALAGLLLLLLVVGVVVVGRRPKEDPLARANALFSTRRDDLEALDRAASLAREAGERGQGLVARIEAARARLLARAGRAREAALAARAYARASDLAAVTTAVRATLAPELALEALDELEKLKAPPSVVALERAAARLALGQASAARAELAKCAQVSSASVARRARLGVQLALGDEKTLDAAREAAREAPPLALVLATGPASVALAPDLEPRAVLARALLQRAQTLASEHLHAAALLFEAGRSAPVRLELARQLEARGAIELAHDALLELSPEPEVLRARARIEHAFGDGPTLAALERAQDPLADDLRARRSWLDGDDETARAHYARARAADPSDDEAALVPVATELWRAVAENRPAERVAPALLERARRVGTGDPFVALAAWSVVALGAVAADDADSLRAATVRALELHPEDPAFMRAAYKGSARVRPLVAGLESRFQQLGQRSVANEHEPARGGAGVALAGRACDFLALAERGEANARECAAVLLARAARLVPSPVYLVRAAIAARRTRKPDRARAKAAFFEARRRMAHYDFVPEVEAALDDEIENLTELGDATALGELEEEIQIFGADRPDLTKRLARVRAARALLRKDLRAALPYLDDACRDEPDVPGVFALRVKVIEASGGEVTAARRALDDCVARKRATDDSARRKGGVGIAASLLRGQTIADAPARLVRAAQLLRDGGADRAKLLQVEEECTGALLEAPHQAGSFLVRAFARAKLGALGPANEDARRALALALDEAERESARRLLR